MAEKTSNVADEKIALAVTKPSNLITEFQIPLPLSVEEYHLAQLYGVAEASKNETGGGDGIEILLNREIREGEPYYNKQLALDGKPQGQYTHKRFHLASKVPKLVVKCAPNNSLECDEKAWNCYPDCRTEYSNRYMADNFHIIIETKHKAEMPEDAAMANVHGLGVDDFKMRVIDLIDIANDPLGDPKSKDYKEEEDPAKFHSEKTRRGPLTPAWLRMPVPVHEADKAADFEGGAEPRMCCYKLYRLRFKWIPIGGKVQSMILTAVRKLLFNFHRQIFCWMDKWYGMSVADIRELEEKTKRDLDEMREKGQVKGMQVN